MKKLRLLLVLTVFMACNEPTPVDDLDPKPDKSGFLSAVDISSFPEIELTNPVFYNRSNQPTDFLNILKENGVNTIRLRLWVNPQSGHSGLEEVTAFSQRLKGMGFKIWLSVHYSDSWADPGKQVIPQQWQSLSFAVLKDTVRLYTKKVMEKVNPHYIQIGNEINSGFLHPHGNISTQTAQFKELYGAAAQSVRGQSQTTRIILHFAGIENTPWFFNVAHNIDYDIMGLSYYPVWHGKSLGQLRTILIRLSELHKKDILIAETAYPFTLGWNDWTNNIVGLEEQLILPDYPATEAGQKKFVATIRDMLLKDVKRGIGFCYWGAELIAWKGDVATNASPWENQALFNFQNKALPALEEFLIPSGK